MTWLKQSARGRCHCRFTDPFINWLVWLVAVVAMSACGSSSQPIADEGLVPPKDAIVKETQNGPVKATVSVWPAKPTLSDPIYVRLAVDADPEVAVDLPFQTGQLGEAALGRFRVVDFARVQRRGDNGHQLEEHTYTLQAQSSGRHRIPPFRLESQDRRSSAATSTTGSGSTAPLPAEILTDEIPLEVAAIPVEKITATLQPPYGPMVTAIGQRAWWWWLSLSLIAVFWVAIAVALWRRWKARRAIARQRSAYDEAVAELRLLEDAGAPDVDTADAWFVRLSAIVRRYLESRYEIRAPELTSEEFLLVALRSAELTVEHRGLLASFLECCDRVKFAAYRPQAQESLDTLRAARSFIEDTRLRQVEVALPDRPETSHAA